MVGLSFLAGIRPLLGRPSFHRLQSLVPGAGAGSGPLAGPAEGFFMCQWSAPPTIVIVNRPALLPLPPPPKEDHGRLPSKPVVKVLDVLKSEILPAPMFSFFTHG